MQIQDGSISASDLADGSVTNAKLASNSVSAAKISSGAITQSHIASNAIGGAQLQLNAISPGHLGTGSVTSAAIADGTILPADLGFSPPITGWDLKNATLPVAPGLQATIDVACDAGKKPLGGGFTKAGGLDVDVSQSLPIPTGWRIIAANAHPTLPRNVTAYVICAR